MTTKALIYCRVSSKKQVKEGDGLGSQEFRCLQFAAARGLSVEKIFHEKGYTGRGDFAGRPAMTELLKYLEANPNCQYYVIFDDLKRFARDTLFHFKLKHELESRGAILLCPKFKFDKTPEGKFMETMTAAFGELETNQNRIQALERMTARLHRGYWVFRHVPPGYTYITDPVHNRLLSPVYPEARIIKKALEGFASKRFITKTEVLHYLKRHPLTSKGKILVNDLKLVNRILGNILYTGYIEYPKWKIPRTKGHHKPLISLDTYEQVQERLLETQPKTKRFNTADFPLKQVVKCACCQRGFTSSTVKGRSQYYPYYACYSKNCTAFRKNHSKQKLETEYVEYLRKIQPEETTLSFVMEELKRGFAPKEATLKSRIQTQKKVIAQKEEEISALLRRSGKAKTDTLAERYEGEIEQLEAEIKRMKTTLKKMTKPDLKVALDLADNFFRTAPDTWLKGDTATKIAIHQLIFPASLYYDLKTGFRTAAKSLPFEVFDRFQGGKNALADIKENVSNQFMGEIMAWVPVLKGVYRDTLSWHR